MTVANGRQFLSIPGPTNVPDEVLQAMHRPAMDIYAGEMIGITDSCMADLQKIFRTKGRIYIYAANGHGGWEAAFTNVLSRGDTVLVLESGRFARGWGEMAQMMGVEVQLLKAGWRRAVDPAAVEERLKRDKSHTIKAIFVVQIDTASGVVNDIPAIRKAMDAAKHPALLMVDGVASLGCMPFDMDAWGIDVAMSGSQKGLMTPPGLAFVAANERAREVHKTAEPAHAVLGLDLPRGRDPLPEVLRHASGAPAVRPAQGDRYAAGRGAGAGIPAPQAAGRGDAAGGGEVGRRGRCWQFSIPNPAERANSITCILMQGRDPQPLLDYCRDKCDVVLGVGLGELTGKAFRIAHMGHCNAPMVLGTLGAVEMGLKALGIPHGSGGVQAAVEYLGREVGP